MNAKTNKCSLWTVNIMYSTIQTRQLVTRCIVCSRPLAHNHNWQTNLQLFSRCAHYHCSVLMIALNETRRKNRTIQKFSQRCIKYGINHTDKTLYMKLADRYL